MAAFSKEIKISLTAICTVMLLFYGINFLKGIDLFKKSNVYYVCFKDVTGLAKSNAVYANGFPIGIVREITYDYDHPGNVYVGIEIDDHMHIPQGTKAELESKMIGGTTMNLILGHGAKYMEPGDSIQGGPYYGALEKVSDMLPAVQQLMPKLDSILASINIIMANPAISKTINNAQEVTANLTETTERINSMLRNDLPKLTAKMNRIGDNVEVLTAKLKDLDYARTLNDVNQTVAEVQQFTKDLNGKINSSNNSLGLLLNSRGLYDNLNKTLVSSDSLVMDLKNHPKRYVHFSVFGRKEKR